MIWLAVLSQLLLTGIPSRATGTDSPESVTIRGEEFDVWPVEELIRRGLDVQRLGVNDNAAWVYFKAINRYEDVPAEAIAAFDYTIYGWPGEATALEEYLDRPSTREAIDLATRAAKMEQCQFPYFGDPGGSILMVLLPNLAANRVLGKIIHADGRRLEHAGDFDGALERYVTLLRMGGHMGEGVTLIEALVGFALWTRGADSIANMALRHDLPPQTLELAAKHLTRLAARQPGVERGIEAERTMATIVVDELCSRPSKFLQNLHSLTVVHDVGEDETHEWDINVNPQTPWELMERETGRLLIPHKTIKKHINDYFDEMMDHLETPDEPFDSEGYLDRHVPPWDVVARTLLPALSRAVDLERRTRATTGLAQSVVAIRLYEAKLGVSPRTPSDFETFLPQVMRRDPFANGSLMFRSQNSAWVVYSIGPNLVDDGGREGEKWDSLDITYQFPPKPLPEFQPE